METRKIVRANGAGVFFGEVVEKNGGTQGDYGIGAGPLLCQNLLSME